MPETKGLMKRKVDIIVQSIFRETMAQSGMMISKADNSISCGDTFIGHVRGVRMSALITLSRDIKNSIFL